MFMNNKEKPANITWHRSKVETKDREALLGQKGGVVWLTGLSGSGKSTIAFLLEERLTKSGRLAFVLDGDNVRHGLNQDLKFSAEDRAENIRRIGEVAALFSQAGVITITAFISPYIEGRMAARRAAGEDRFIEVYLDVSLAECEKRDPKGLYRKARAGDITGFTGVDDPYESSPSPEIILNTGIQSPLECSESILKYLRKRSWLSG
jgi:adenylyl-sulfate kinase